MPHEIETPSGPVRRDTLHSLSALSTHTDPADRPTSMESKWPKDYRAWLCLLGGFLLMFNSWGIVNAYGTYASYYTQELFEGQDILRMNLLGSTECFMILTLSAPVGRFLDAGHSRMLIVIGTVLVSLGSFLLAAVNSGNVGRYGLTWFTQGFITGLGMACFFVTSSQVVATWFKAKKGLAIGIVASGASISGLVYPIMLRFLINQHGFTLAVIYEAIVICGTSVIAIIIARPNPEHVIRKPEKWMNLRVFWDTHAFRNRSFTFMVASIAFLFFGFYCVFFNLEEWAIAEGFGYRPTAADGANAGLPHPAAQGKVQTMYLLATMNGASTLGRVSSAYLCDHFGALNVHCIVTFVASLLTLMLWSLANNLSATWAFVIVFGAFSGAVIGLPPASVAYILGPDPKEQAKLGQWTGMMYTAAGIPSLIGPIVAGHLISEYGTFLTVQLWSGACILLSSVCMACAIYCRQKAKKTPALSRETTQSVGSTAQEKQDV
ncbi:hypothetical protein PRZ48_011538 [Zasmidium cellare]|uniref:Major facilitator superfamily (MFS) profile domain-containing protein n=1 Tax=Zasmidium cellare TaxID=395010 RepID=A0ABR0E6M2_ZASCE|nr:hypothetical protein PRZ48_011538 [Zasmidium cellare]